MVEGMVVGFPEEGVGEVVSPIEETPVEGEEAVGAMANGEELRNFHRTCRCSEELL